ncbi:hypothetical protein KUTeg_024440 [Tegillarca granosa]|uniref:Uncharacterized protein n=1 Tax=Tegillarca granosa TaxID=220873 RepID=A0ABQ9DXW2_TEGGR|nr:hypothetical protein KUTeg_024440 [Tegillarca granosa]
MEFPPRGLILKSIDDDSDILQSPTLNQTYTSSGSYLYMTQWSFGSTNDAFEIAYIADVTYS